MRFNLILLFLIFCVRSDAFEMDRIITPGDDPKIFDSTHLLERNLNILDATTLRRQDLNLIPWADGSWRLRSGLIAGRYADPVFSQITDWSESFNYIEAHSIQNILNEADPKTRAELIDQLSPAEKYDLLVGDDEFTLTAAQWRIGKTRYQNYTLENWMGICEGSAAASSIYPEPKKTIELMSSRGDLIRFHILDIKALGSLLWSAYNVTIPISGGRCLGGNPQKDYNGVIMDDDCFNSNPATWHIALLNFVGQRKQTFFINRSLNRREVWNAPVIGYQINYFNIVSGTVQQDLSSARMPMSLLPTDKYTPYRSSQTAEIIGVDVTVKLAAGLTSRRDETESAYPILLNYQYDLELDANGKLIGGEWRHDTHPSFIWAITQDIQPQSLGDHQLKDQAWNGGVVPENWMTAIRLSSSHNQPLELIVKQLFDMAQ